MRNKKRLITAVLALCTFTGSMVMPVYAAETTDLQLIINDTLYVASDEQVSAQLIEGRTYVPISFLGAALDYRVQWLKQSRKVCIFTDESTPFYAEDAFPSVAEETTIQILIDGEVLEIAPTYGVPFLHEKGRAMVPLSVVAAKLNCDVAWQDGVVLVTEIPKAVSEPSDNRDNQVADVTD
ncbi:MAG: copper amine oxidase N-terminal domain-containing protein, partial [Peptococcaceae bacterium]|nr:copper amine oxidase N-terminal domain-containing protein [Peptococcaceae bacterium]